MTEMAYDAPPSVDDAEISRQRLATRAAKPLQWFLKLLPGIALLLFWQWASGRLIKEIYVSKPTAVAHRLFELFASGEIYPHLWTTGQELVLGYVIGVAGGVIGGYALGRSPRLARIFGPYVMAFYGVPKIALAPLFIIWFGIGMGSKIALASIMVFFLVFYNVFAGVRSVDRELVNLTLVMGANQRQLTYHVFLPAAVRNAGHAAGHSLQRDRRHRRRIHLFGAGARPVHSRGVIDI